MKTLKFDSGIQEFKINGGILRFNPGDPNVYARFMEASDSISQIENELVERGKTVSGTDEQKGAAILRIISDADKKVKDVLAYVFGKENDFEKIFGGVNVLAVGANGERVITNMLAALLPVIKEGVENYTNQQVGDAVQQAKQNRAQRRAQK